MQQERERVGAVGAAGLDVDAEVPEGLEDGGERALPGARVAVEAHGSAGERGGRRHEPHHGAGQPAVDGGRLGIPAPQAVVGADPHVLPVDRDRDAQRGQRAGHQRGVPAGRGTGDEAVPAGERRQQQGPVRQRFGAGHRDRAVHRSARGRGGPADGGSSCGDGHPHIIAHRASWPVTVSDTRGKMDPCAAATPPPRRPPTSPTSSAPSTRPTRVPTGRTTTSRRPRTSRSSWSAIPGTPTASRTRTPPSARCARSAGAWCRSGRRTCPPARGW